MPKGEMSAPDEGKTSAEGFADVFAARAFGYDIVKRAFIQEPSEKFLSLLVEGRLVRVFPFADTDAAMGNAVQKIGAYLEQPDVLSRKNHDSLRRDYTRMFRGQGKVVAPPRESMYRDAGHLHFSDVTLDVRNAYRAYHLTPKGLDREPDDHIGLELDFMHKLCLMAKEKAEKRDETGVAAILKDQRAFLDEHLLQWVPAWTKDVVKSAATDFYGGMAQLLDAYLQLDHVLVAEMLVALGEKS